MRAIELPVHKWFSRIGLDKRLHERCEGSLEVVEGVLAVPVRPITPVVTYSGFYIPADEEVVPYNLTFVRVA